MSIAALFKAVAVEKKGAHWHVLLDGKPIKAPSGKVVEIVTKELAEKIAGEWRKAEKKINLLLMPFTRLAISVTECDERRRDAAIRHLLSYAETELMCYREPKDAALIARQNATWNPWLEWMQKEFGMQLPTHRGIVADAATVTVSPKVSAHIQALPDRDILLLEQMVGMTGSFVLGLALIGKKLTVAEVLAAAFLDENYQREQWGEDAESADRQLAIAKELNDLTQFQGLSG